MVASEFSGEIALACSPTVDVGLTFPSRGRRSRGVGGGSTPYECVEVTRGILGGLGRKLGSLAGGFRPIWCGISGWCRATYASCSLCTAAPAVNTSALCFRPCFGVPSPEVLREMVRLGVGWAVLPPVQAESGAEPLAPARRTPLATRRLVVARRAGAPSDAALDALVAVLG